MSNSQSIDVDSTFLTATEAITNDYALATELRALAFKHGFTRRAQEDILSLLRKYGHTSLPKSSEGLMKTIHDPKNTNIEALVKSNGHMFYLGIVQGIMKVLTSPYLVDRDTIELDFFWDGLSPFKSVKCEVWPILGRLARTRKCEGSSPFLVGVYSGRKKPDPHEFMEKFVKDAKNLENDGLIFEGKHYRVVISKFIADQPARCRMNCRAGEGAKAYYQCERCNVKGKNRGFITCFNARVCRNAEPRTDKSFREKWQPEHHKGDSPFLPLSIDMIHTFVIDSMHLLYQGVVKRWWSYLDKETKRNLKHSLGKTEIEMISLHMKTVYKDYFPASFARRVRGLNESAHWKATEWRRFLLYEGLLVVKKFMHKRVYKNFLLLFCAVRILSSEELMSDEDLLHDAKELLQLFVQDVDETFDRNFVTIKAHLLTFLMTACVMGR